MEQTNDDGTIYKGTLLLIAEASLRTIRASASETVEQAAQHRTAGRLSTSTTLRLSRGSLGTFFL
jgi:hypothetical protein